MKVEANVQVFGAVVGNQEPTLRLRYVLFHPPLDPEIVIKLHDGIGLAPSEEDTKFGHQKLIARPGEVRLGDEEIFAQAGAILAEAGVELVPFQEIGVSSTWKEYSIAMSRKQFEETA